MGLAGYISGKPRKSTGQRYDDIARRDILALGYKAAKTKWENPSTIKSKKASGHFGQFYIKQAPNILRHIESVNVENRRSSPQPTPIGQAEVRQFGRKKARRRGRGANILAGRLTNKVLNFGKSRVGE